MEKKNCKGSPIGPGDSISLKMIFVLLPKVVAVHVQISIVYIWHFNLKG